MIDKLVKWFEQHSTKEVDNKHTVELATAVLFYEIIRADDKFDASEVKLKRRLLNAHFSLTDDDVRELCQQAELAASQAVDFSQFTRVIHDTCSLDEKIEIVESLWKLAFSDGQLDGHEEYLIRKISDLLYLDHKHFIQAKHRAQEQFKKV